MNGASASRLWRRAMPVATRRPPPLKRSTPICRRSKPASRCRQKTKPKRWRKCAAKSSSGAIPGRKTVPAFPGIAPSARNKPPLHPFLRRAARRSGQRSNSHDKTVEVEVRPGRGRGRTGYDGGRRQAVFGRPAGRETCRGEHCEQRRIDRRCRQQLVQLVVEQLVELQFEFVQQFELEFVLQQLVELELQLFEQLQLEFFVERLRPRLAPSPLGAGEKRQGPDHPAPVFAETKRMFSARRGRPCDTSLRSAIVLRIDLLALLRLVRRLRPDLGLQHGAVPAERG